jgi:hypothetical protein
MATTSRRSVRGSVSEAARADPVCFLRERCEGRVEPTAMLRSIPFVSMSSPASSVDVRRETGDTRELPRQGSAPDSAPGTGPASA